VEFSDDPESLLSCFFVAIDKVQSELWSVLFTSSNLNVIHD